MGLLHIPFPSRLFLTTVNVRRLLLTLILSSLLVACSPRLVNIPFDPGGRSLNSPFADVQPRVSGRYILFVSDRGDSPNIYLYDTIASVLVDLPGLNAIDMVVSSPAMSENGRFIVFCGSRDGQSAIYLYDRDTRQLRNLTENLKATVRNPTITADGSKIAFESSADGQWDILLYNRFGEPIEGITRAPERSSVSQLPELPQP